METLRKSFFKDYKNHSVIKEWDGTKSNQIIKEWNKEIPQHVKKLNTYYEDRNYVIYLALMVEYHINRNLEILFPDFDKILHTSETNINTKINILSAFRLFPDQVFQALRCIKDFRNEFAHNFSIINLNDINNLPQKRKNKTIVKLLSLTKEFEGDFNYQDSEDTIRNKFKSLCLNTITALKIYEPIVINLRKQKIEK
jgi:hypothetical protein